MAARHLLTWTVAALAALFAAEAHAQDAAAAQACEFHVWTSQGISVVGQGVGGGSTLVLPSGTMNSIAGDYVGRDSASAFFHADPEDQSSPLSPELQRDLLAGLNLADQFGLSGYRVTFHAEAIPSIALRRKDARLTTSTAPCYAELVLQDVAYSIEYSRDDKLRTLFFFRKFGERNGIEKRFSTFTQQKLEITPRKKNVDKNAWKAAIKEAFVKNVAEFAVALDK